MFEIPISQETIIELSKTTITNLDSVLVNLSTAELSSIIFLMKMNETDESISSSSVAIKAERNLSNIINITLSDRAAVTQIISSSLNPLAIQNNISILNSHNISLMTNDRIALGEYLMPDGRWNNKWKYANSNLESPEFLTSRFSKPSFTNDQVRLFNGYLADRDESMHIEGVAGSGKTEFLSMALESLEDSKVAIFAMTRQQLAAVSNRIKKEVNLLTYGALADEIIENSSYLNIPLLKKRSMTRQNVSHSGLAKLMGYARVGKLSPKLVAEATVQSVTKFCFSSNQVISSKDVPYKYSFVLTKAEQDIIAEHAKVLWQEILYPSKGVNFPIRVYHRTKLVALAKEVIPSRYQYIFVDETHDLPPPIIEIFDNSPQSIITLGDSYQYIGGADMAAKRSNKTRVKALNTSFRVGQNTGRLFNHILDHHPDKPIKPFEGRSGKVTKITGFNKGSLKYLDSGPCTVLGRHSWHLFEAMQHLSHKNADFWMLTTTKNELRWLIQDTIFLYKENIRTTHREFYKHDNWDSFMDSQPSDIQRIISKTILKGYEMKHLDDALDNKCNQSKRGYLIARIEDTKNMEFDRVVLMDDILSMPDTNIYDKKQALNTIYLGATRAKNELILPNDIEGWVSDSFR